MNKFASLLFKKTKEATENKLYGYQCPSNISNVSIVYKNAWSQSKFSESLSRVILSIQTTKAHRSGNVGPLVAIEMKDFAIIVIAEHTAPPTLPLCKIIVDSGFRF